MPIHDYEYIKMYLNQLSNYIPNPLAKTPTTPPLLFPFSSPTTATFTPHAKHPNYSRPLVPLLSTHARAHALAALPSERSQGRGTSDRRRVSGPAG